LTFQARNRLEIMKYMSTTRIGISFQKHILTYFVNPQVMKFGRFYYV